MRDRITANLPAIDFDETETFYQSLGFTTDYRDADWMIMSRNGLEIEFFPHPMLDPSTSWFSACVRVENVDTLYQSWCAAKLPEDGIPRLTKPIDEPWGFRAFALIDLNGSLLRCMAPLPGKTS